MKRNYGIDLLRICSMYMIVVLHVLAQGSILANVGMEPYSLNYRLAWLLEAASYCAVNCFALISGYVGVESHFQYKKGIKLWEKVLFWTVLLTAIYKYYMPNGVEVPGWKDAFLPVTRQSYWYVTAYFCMFPFLPFLNRLLQHLDEKESRTLASIIFIWVSCYPTFMNRDLFTLQNGYTVGWIVLLYLLGGCLKKIKLGRKMKRRSWFLIYLGCVIFAWTAKMWMEVKQTGTVSPNFLLGYTSPTMLLAAIALLLFFAEMKIEKNG